MKFIATTNTAESFQKSRINSGTWVSALNIIGHIGELRPIRKELFKTQLPGPSYPLAQRCSLINQNVYLKVIKALRKTEGDNFFSFFVS